MGVAVGVKSMSAKFLIEASLLVLPAIAIKPQSARPVERGGVVRRNQAALDVVAHAVARALGGIADAGAAGRHHHEAVLRRYGLKALAAHLLAGLQADIAGLAVAAAVAAARRMVDAIERREDVERRIDAAADLDDLA